MNKVKIILTNENKEFSENIHQNLHEYNMDNCNYIKNNYSRNRAKNEKVFGNVILYFNDEIIEKFAKEKGAIGIRTETWSFQAPDFYKKQGFMEYGKLQDSPPGHTEYLLYKKFD